VLSADESRLLTIGQSIQLWNGEGDPVRTLDDGTGFAFGATFSPDDRLVAMEGDNGLVLVDAEDGRRTATLKVGERTATFSPAFSPDGKDVAVAGALTGAHIWDVRSGAGPVDLPARGQVEDIGYSPDGRRMVSWAQDGDRVRVWDIATRKAATLERGGALDVQFSPEGRLVATAHDREVTVRETATRRVIASLRHENLAVGASFDPSGRLVLTVADDATPRLWDARTGRMIRVLTGHANQVTAARFSPDGRSILTAGWDGVALIRACDECLPYDEMVERARSRVTPLTAGGAG
jgi:WD40 repeat protein